MLHPKAKSPPSLKNKAWTVKINEIERKAKFGPSKMASRVEPIIWPLEPVYGIEKLTIWSAKTNAVKRQKGRIFSFLN